MISNIGLPSIFLLLLCFVVFAYPFWRSLPKFGFSKWLSLIAIIPVGAVILIWILAFSEPRKEIA